MIKIKFNLLILLTFLMLLPACESYLDKAPEAGITKEEIFTSFEKFQGFVEDTYFCMADPMVSGSSPNFNFGDDLFQPRHSFMGTMNSDYRAWENSPNCIFYADSYYNPGDMKYIVNPFTVGGDLSGSNSSVSGVSRLGYWHGGWLGIRKTNLAIDNIDMLKITYGKNTTLEDQKNIILGQAYMLRAYFYFHIIRVWGGMPYLTRPLRADEQLNFPRLNYAQTTDSIEKDLLKAIQLLPVDWDQIPTGQISLGTNNGRLTKGAAYALLGKAMLYAGSPLMNGESTGNYNYNVEYCKKAVKYLGEVLKLSAIQGGGVYDLLPWEEYTDNFYGYNNLIPCSGKEAVLNTPILAHARISQIGDLLNSMGGWSLGCGPLENYIQNFGMDNGEPFDPNIYNNPAINPWENRDPRFYKNVIHDGATLMYNAAATPQSIPAEFFLGGRDRDGRGNSDTGYGWTTFRDSAMYASHPSNGWNPTINRRLPVIRLADVYLMYAEAVNEAYGSDVAPSAVDPDQTISLKAWEAVKAVRDRVKLEDGSSLPFPAHLYANANTLRETIRKERAVELAFEGHRWYDIRRWYVADKPEYMRLDVLDFDKDHSYYKVRSYGKKIFEKKHYWMPLKDSQTQIYSGFRQNPGW